MAAGCKFCSIARGEIDSSVVYEDSRVVVFLDHRPLLLGHCLVIPREHIQTLEELSAREIGPFFSAVQAVARGVERAMGAEGTYIAINNRVSQSVPHLHVHVVPRRKGDGWRGSFWPRQRYQDQAGERKVAEAIGKAIRDAGGKR